MAVISFVGTSPGGAKSTRYIVAGSVEEARARAKNMGFTSYTGFKVVPKGQEPEALKSPATRDTLAKVGTGVRATTTPSLDPRERALAQATTPYKPVTSGLGKELLDNLLKGVGSFAKQPLQQVGAGLGSGLVAQFLRDVGEQSKPISVGPVTGRPTKLLTELMADLTATAPRELGRQILGEESGKDMTATSGSGKALLNALLGGGGEEERVGSKAFIERFGKERTPEQVTQELKARQRAAFTGGIASILQFTGAGEAAVGKIADPVLSKIVKGFKKPAVGLAQKLLGRFGKVAEEGVSQFFKRTLVDRLSPLEELSKRALKDIPFEDNFYKLARLFAGTSGAYEAKIREALVPVLKREANRLDDLSALLYLRRAEELGRRKIKILPGEEITQGIAELGQKLGREGFTTLQHSADEVVQFGRGLLKQMRDSGLISHTEYRRLARAGESWVPLEVVSDAFENLAKGQFSQGSLNVSSTKSILQAIKGGEEVARRNPLEALIERGLNVHTLAEKNDVLRKLARFGLDNPDMGVLKVSSPDAAKRLGLGAISFFDNGRAVTLAVPRPVEIAVKNLDRVSLGVAMGAANLSAKILRAGATGFNIAFIPVNVMRDMGNAIFTKFTRDGIGEGVRFVTHYPLALIETAIRGPEGRELLGKQLIKPSKIYSEWLESGGGQAIITSQIFRDPQAYIRGISKKPTLIKKLISAPKDLVKFASRVGEESTRLTEFITQRRAGLTPREAAFASRDITVDFARSGSALKALNSVVPFINANLQGLARVGTLAKDNPVKFATWMGVMGGTPTYTLYLHNRKFSDFDAIPDYERQTNWVIIARDRTDEEKKNNAPLVAIKIPKPHFFQPFTAMLEGALGFFDGRDKSILDTLADTLENASPIGLPIGEERTLRSLGTLLPPGIESLGLLTGALPKELFTGRQVVPRGQEEAAPEEQYTERTPEVFVRLGKVFGISPNRLEAALRAQTAGLGSQLSRLASSALPSTLPKEEPVSQIQEIRDIPILGDIIRRFVGATPSDEAGYERVSQAKQQSSTRLLAERREAKKIWLEIKPLPSGDRKARLSQLKTEGTLTKELYDRVVDLATEDALGITPLDNLIKAVSPPERAELIAQDRDKFPDNTAWRNYLSDLKEKGILTKSTFEELQKIMGSVY